MKSTDNGSNSCPNLSGIRPTEFKVLVRLDKMADKIGNVYLPDSKKEQWAAAQEIGVFVHAGRRAFEDWPDEDIPAPGDRVIIARYEGRPMKGSDREEYRLLHDKDILAFCADDVETVR